MKVRTRFAPSPTGSLHLGGGRTALYAWLYAKKWKGQFILRIDDTDRERSTSQAVDVILKGLNWLGLDYDEGPYFQSQRLARYQEVLAQLLVQGHAYRCYCSKERLASLRDTQLKQRKKPRYDGYCRDLKTGPLSQPYVIRFRNPLEGQVTVKDLVHGSVIFQNAELDDLIIARSDGTPTYNFTVVVDDSDMAITHIIRGDDHLANTPRQINLLLALGQNIPVYAHLPMILDSHGKKLSKRADAASLLYYQEKGYLKDAVLNYLVRLGWSHGDQEIFSREEMIAYFDLDALNRAPASINAEKLNWLNQYYLRTEDVDQLSLLVKLLDKELKKRSVVTTRGPDLLSVFLLQRERVKTLSELAEKSVYFYQAPSVDSYLLDSKDKEVLLALTLLKDRFKQLQDWSKEAVAKLLTQVSLESKVKLGKLAAALRLILTGTTVSPPINAVLYVLGQREVLARLHSVLEE